MSVYSMTGYASGQQTAHGSTEDAPAWKNAQPRVGLELRSVNSRFLDLGFRLSDELRQHEPALRELLGQRLKRGKVELRAYLQGRDAGTLADPPPRVLQRLASVQDQVRVWLPDAAPLSVADALRAASSAEPADDEGTAKALMELAQTVLDDFVAARAREGARLAKLIRERVAQLRELARAAEPLVPQAVQAQKERFIARWHEALASGDGQVGPEAAQERALAEATAFAIRIDVAEELGRLAAHLDEIEAVLKKGGEVGKRLDFLIQELHREANTLGSKSAALELTRVSVDMKVLIEQMREQVQNIE
ncbi:YicC/YloC family endoribonuclease [Ottowia beijingensis]|uniref:YicC/YloC family endoribonuclease n=1 Tax=Ottowia beijingensis TaxID=1207057 RepID=UPI003626114B